MPINSSKITKIFELQNGNIINFSEHFKVTVIRF